MTTSTIDRQAADLRAVERAIIVARLRRKWQATYSDHNTRPVLALRCTRMLQFDATIMVRVRERVAAMRSRRVPVSDRRLEDGRKEEPTGVVVDVIAAPEKIVQPCPAGATVETAPRRSFSKVGKSSDAIVNHQRTIKTIC